MKEEFDLVEAKEKAPQKMKVDQTKSYFDGQFIEYIGYKLLAFLITIVTLTIAKPWADKLILDYKINHTKYNGKRLKFEGTGASLFVQRFKWYFFAIITLGIYIFWIPIKMEKWVASNTHFEDEALTEGESYFDGKLIQLIGINIFTYLLTLMSLGLLLPFAMCYKQKWIAKHTIINCKKLVFDGKALSLIGHYLLWYLLTIITLGIYGLWLPIKLYSWQVKNTHIKLKEEEYEKTNYIPLIIGGVLLVIFIALLIKFIPKLEIPALISGDKTITETLNVFSNPVTWDTDGGDLKQSKKYKIGDVIDEMPIPKRDGYEFLYWVNESGEKITKGYVIKDRIFLTAIWKDTSNSSNTNTNTNTENDIKPNINTTNNNNTNTNNNSNNVVEEAPLERCNSGFIYNDGLNKCINPSDHTSAWTENIYDESGEIYASGIKCPNGYLITWDIEPAGECFRVMEPNY